MYFQILCSCVRDHSRIDDSEPNLVRLCSAKITFFVEALIRLIWWMLGGCYCVNLHTSVTVRARAYNCVSIKASTLAAHCNFDLRATNTSVHRYEREREREREYQNHRPAHIRRANSSSRTLHRSPLQWHWHSGTRARVANRTPQNNRTTGGAIYMKYPRCHAWGRGRGGETLCQKRIRTNSLCVYSVCWPLAHVHTAKACGVAEWRCVCAG